MRNHEITTVVIRSEAGAKRIIDDAELTVRQNHTAVVGVRQDIELLPGKIVRRHGITAEFNG